MRTFWQHIVGRHQETGIQFIKFALVGVLNSLLHYIVFLALYRLVGMHYLIASAIGYCVGLLNSFLLNKKWTFKTVDVGKGYEFFKFVIVNIVSLTVNVVVLEVTVVVLHMAPELGQIVALACHTLTNFSGNKFWTFSKPKNLGPNP